MDLRFRSLTDDDMPMLHQWLNDPEIVEWWEGDDVSWSGVIAEYKADPTGTLEHWIVESDNRPVGWIQCYEFDDERDDQADWAQFGVQPGAAGIDYLIGVQSERGKGLGSLMLQAFVDDVAFGLHPQWQQVVADPHVQNVASWRSLEKAGFHELAIIANTWKLMGLDRKANSDVEDRGQRAMP